MSGDKPMSVREISLSLIKRGESTLAPSATMVIADASEVEIGAPFVTGRKLLAHEPIAVNNG